MMRSVCLGALLLTASQAVMPAGDPPKTAPQPPRGGPYFHRILSASSADGLNWTLDAGVRMEHASVPCAIVHRDTIYLYYVDANRGPGLPESVGCAVSSDGIHFTKQPFLIEGVGGGFGFKALDPSIILDENGVFRLYYFACRLRPDEAGAHAIRVATSRNGIGFVDSGIVFQQAALVDPDVFRFGETWFMYVFGEGGTVVAESNDGWSFRRDRTLPLDRYGTTAPLSLADGRLRLYAFQQNVPLGNAVHSFLSRDGINWEREPGVRLQARPDEQITDPFVVRWKGGYRMYFKVEDSSVAARRSSGGAGADPPPSSLTPPSRPDREGRPGPWDHDVRAYRVTPDGTAVKTATFERAGVPAVALMRDGRLIAAHQHFPVSSDTEFDKVAVRFSLDSGQTWTDPRVIRLLGLPPGMRFPFDPTLVSLPDGRIRLYFTSTFGQTFQDGIPGIYSAISEDGITYLYEPGIRFSIEGRPVIDCAVVLHRGVFHLYAPDNGPTRSRGEIGGPNAAQGKGYHAVSYDGLNFTRSADVAIDATRTWLGCAVSDGRRITFFGTGGPQAPGRGGVWRATSLDGSTFAPSASLNVGGVDPGVVMLPDGSLVVVATGEPRPGTASARHRGQSPR